VLAAADPANPYGAALPWPERPGEVVIGHKPGRKAGALVILVDGELVLYDPDEQRLHVLNPTAGLIWRLCDGKHRESDLVATLVDRYPRNRSAIEEDVPRIIERFRSEGLLQS
jgi:hypothetical protein